MQAGGGQHIDYRTTSDLQVLDEVEGVELGSALRDLRQVPALGRRWAPLTACRVNRAVAQQHPMDGGPAGHDRVLRRGLRQAAADRYGPVFPKHAGLQQRAHAQDAALGAVGQPIHRQARLVALEVSAVKPLPLRPGTPQRHGRNAHTKGTSHVAHAASIAHRLNHLSAPVCGSRTFFKRTPSKRPSGYRHAASAGPAPAQRLRHARGKLQSPKGSFHFPRAFNPITIHCSANAETQVFDER